MKNLKRFLCLAMALVFVFALAACNNETENQGTSDDDQNTVGPSQGGETNTNPQPTAFENNIEFALPNSEGTVKASSDVDGYFISKTDNFYAIINENDDTDSTYAKIEYIESSTAEDLSPDFIDKNVGSLENLEFPGTIQIGVDGVYAEMVIGSDDTRYVEAYLINTDNGGVVAITISVSADLKDAEYDGLHQLVDSFQIVK